MLCGARLDQGEERGEGEEKREDQGK